LAFWTQPVLQPSVNSALEIFWFLSLPTCKWLPKQSVGDEVVALLPRGKVVLNRETEAALVRAFGNEGEFEARRS
jgi:hypothetical protein